MVDNTRVSVTQADLAAVIGDLADRVADWEGAIRPAIPLDRSYGIHDCFRRAAEAWAGGDRGMRTHPVVNTYGRAFDRAIDDDLRTLLVALDAKVIAFDDIIDTRRPTQDQKICAAAIAAFTSPLEFRTLPAGHADAVADVLNEYWTVLSQIPLVERWLLGSFRRATDPERRLAACRAIYAYRGRDADAFVRVPTTIHGIDGPRAERYLEDLRRFRSRYLLFEDFRHISRDLGEGHTNPAIVLMNVLEEPPAVVDVIDALHADFAYAADGGYADVLASLEREPDDLARMVRESMRVLAGQVP